VTTQLQLINIIFIIIICPTYKGSFQDCWDNIIPLFLHAAIYLEVSLFHWTSQNAFSCETAVYKWYYVQCCIAALHLEARPRPTALLPPCSNGKTRGCYCSCWAPDDGHEDTQNVLSCMWTSSNKLEKLLHLVGWFIWIVLKVCTQNSPQTVSISPSLMVIRGAVKFIVL
jgi:hypothetical protein